ncbi:Pyridoxal 4-dehydrogenase [Bosea sp. 62]|uniref:aldo/keto reductase n=1 Tax=unclassified Bosea (in: a-proteobacteria) TaxID=2653178 RepID=UPI0012510A01|nr:MULTISPECIES: aldo/keto reductase [unclassified Bosea (in: a-proteobacteria)]CAD5252944.1 Pyridoxal 4-dehydrogenase [Bosea sp. 46]CAD5257604.1 Pyridoxal 4-dehydrogenase [Bosea sp. 21B]CAD5283329.1 Pyridoxal 4-dehydrogenase [Bosea sp. 7B]VVT52200.1 Pyridoxal 4-dehydrogenase [Bosea sp. EC-HK365B]VXB37121.1 Pyridoxal 4-dehydrogenase [Bosea sp. 29B]
MTTFTLPVRPLGRSGLRVTTLGFGGAPLGDLYAHLDEAGAIATVETALASGINLIDTSPLYGHGLSEHRIGAALRRSGRKDVVISTKVGRVAEPFAGRGNGSGYLGGLPHGLRFDYSYDGTMRSLEQSALRLGVDHIDVVLIHDVDVWTHGQNAIEARFAQAMDGAYRALDKLRAAGAVKAIGVGVNEAEMCERFANAGDFDTMLLAGRYSLLEQPGLATFMPLAQQKGIGLMLGGVFNSGILATGPVAGARYNYQPAPPAILTRVAAIKAVCARHDVPLRRAALQFPLGHPAVASLVMGAVKPEEVADQVAELSAPVPAALWTELKTEGLLGADVPVPA